MFSTSIAGTVAPAACGVTAAAFTSAPWWVALVGITASVVIDLYSRKLMHYERLAVLDTGSAEHYAAMLTALNDRDKP